MSATVNINCRNGQLGNTNLTYNFQPYGISVVQYGFNLMLVPVHFAIWNNGYYSYTVTGGRVIMVNDYSITIESSYNNSQKYDYCVSFSAPIDSMTVAIQHLEIVSSLGGDEIVNSFINLFLLK
jgi:hypothetical protein